MAFSGLQAFVIIGSSSFNWVIDVVQQGNQLGVPGNTGNMSSIINGASRVMPNIIKDHHVSVLGTNFWEAATLELLVIFYIQVDPCQSEPCIL